MDCCIEKCIFFLEKKKKKWKPRVLLLLWLWYQTKYHVSELVWSQYIHLNYLTDMTWFKLVELRIILQRFNLNNASVWKDHAYDRDIMSLVDLSQTERKVLLFSMSSATANFQGTEETGRWNEAMSTEPFILQADMVPFQRGFLSGNNWLVLFYHLLSTAAVFFTYHRVESQLHRPSILYCICFVVFSFFPNKTCCVQDFFSQNAVDFLYKSCLSIHPA